jgi:hypothetical protein
MGQLDEWAKPVLSSLAQCSQLLLLSLAPQINRGELCSFYLLLLNYIVTVVGQSPVLGGKFHTPPDSIWVIGLFIANLLFILILLGGLSVWVRAVAGSYYDWWLALFSYIFQWIRECCEGMDDDELYEDDDDEDVGVKGSINEEEDGSTSPFVCVSRGESEGSSSSFTGRLERSRSLITRKLSVHVPAPHPSLQVTSQLQEALLNEEDEM